MKLTFCGANREVTGSCHLLTVGSKNILVDCGMFQGSNFNAAKNYDEFPFDPKDIDVLLVTHAHLDHIGRIPKLMKEGFHGKIFMTKATKEFAPLIWHDAQRIMQYNHRKYQYPILYEESDIAAVREICTGVSYHEEIEVVPGITAVFKDAGHIYGSSFIEVQVEGKKIVFSGDIGNDNVPILKETETLEKPDIIICESTYGDRLHESVGERKTIIANVIKDGVKKGGTIMMPAFSLERTQELLYELHELYEHDKNLPKIPIFLDSPLAIDATKVYKHFPEYYDADAMKHYSLGEDFLSFPNLKITRTSNESKKLNSMKGPKLIIAGAGMMNGGRIVHHALRYLSDEKSSLILVGYQAYGTLGRRLYEGADEVQIFHEKIKVRATVKALGALSAHGDQKKLLNWMSSGDKMPEKVFFVHGEPHAATDLSHRLRDDQGVQGVIPEYAESIELE